MLRAALRAGSQHELLHKLLPNFTECSCVQTLHLIFLSNLPTDHGRCSLLLHLQSGKAQRDEVTCPRSHSQETLEPGLKRDSRNT